MTKNWANIPFSPRKWPFFYGWMILVWGVVGFIMSIPGQTIGVSVFTDSLIEVLGISRDQLSLAYMFGTIGSSFMLPWAGRMYDRLGVRPVVILAGIGLGGVLIIFSQLDLLLAFFISRESHIAIIFIMVVAFLCLRFFGQGVLTISSRNMMVQWFDKRRGFAIGFANVAISLCFSSSPVVMYYLINNYEWSGAWLFLAIIVGIFFPVFAFIFFRNKPEDAGLIPDGKLIQEKKDKNNLFPFVKEFTRRDAMKQFAFWLFALMLAMQGLFITGFTFNVLSIFEEAGLSKDTAITIFQPAAAIAVIVTLISSNISDYIPLKYLMYVKGITSCVAIIGIIFLGEYEFAYYLVVIGMGVFTGLYSVINTLVWPRYFGRRHLGAISGQAMMMVVFGSALGPLLFSTSLSQFGTYANAAWICFAVYVLLTIGSFWADNPQIKLVRK